MPDLSPLDTYRFSTLDVPEKERFEAWAGAMSTCDYQSPSDTAVPFDVEFHAVRFGPFVLTSHRWIRHAHTVSYRAIRSARKIRADGLDHFHLMFQLTGSSADGFGPRWVQSRIGELYVCDMSLPFDCVVTAGDIIGLLVRRDMLGSLDVSRRINTIDPVMGGVLAEHLLTLQGSMEKLGAGDVPYVVRATNALLRAGLMRSSEASHGDLPETDLSLVRQARQFIVENLHRADLTPEVIGEAICISRAKLYKLFQGSGGVMRQVQRQRLDRAYDVLTDPDMPKERVAHVAWRHGFNDEKYFSRIFRAAFGCTPREAMETRRISSSQPQVIATRTHGPTFVQWLKADAESRQDSQAS
ncbi:helix-turn-helix domain-containing protein [Burkholderia sp. Bp9012]|uniref:helix-turn-helix domain-containing protein n=1 Tax=Burkholderia sp. Bp9012 TaxID=2184562 RepID=UPI000F5A7830|nr:helix-turn-helix domain-containing protein [Burkholderia sp. Bp9012]RQR79215.1 helix-turn-helix domain-containing protein [Burkholderia sp. Bp9012]